MILVVDLKSTSWGAKMEIIPVNKKILLKPIEETKTEGGIYLAQQEQFDLVKAEVVSLGEKVTLSIKPGDIILFDKIGLEKIGDYVIVDETKVIAIVR